MLANIKMWAVLGPLYLFGGIIAILCIPHLLYWTWEIIVFFVQNYLAWIFSYMGYQNEAPYSFNYSFYLGFNVHFAFYYGLYYRIRDSTTWGQAMRGMDKRGKRTDSLRSQITIKKGRPIMGGFFVETVY